MAQPQVPLTWGTAWSCRICLSGWSDSTMFREHCLVKHLVSLGPSTGETTTRVANVSRQPPGETEDESYDIR